MSGKVNKKRKVKIAFLIAIPASLSCALLVYCFIVFIQQFYLIQLNPLSLEYYFNGKCGTIDGTIHELSYDEYNNDFSDLTEICNHRGKIFPKTINHGNISGFLFSERHTSDAGIMYRSELYLQWTLESHDFFDEEIERLLSISSNNKNVVFTNDLFPLPAYVTEYNEEGGFEYVLLDKSNLTLNYIFLKGVGSYSEIVFNDNYAPHLELKESDFPKNKIYHNSYSIYVYRGNGK